MTIFKCGKHQIICESTSTRNGFKHTATLFRNGFSIRKATCHYLNRTWECFTFQSVALKVLDGAPITARSKTAFLKKLSGRG